MNRPAPHPLQASRLLACLQQGEQRGSGDPYSAPTRLVTIWRLLAALNAQQLRALSDCPQFYDLPHTDAPEEPLPAGALAAVLEVRWQADGSLSCEAAGYRLAFFGGQVGSQ